MHMHMSIKVLDLTSGLQAAERSTSQGQVPLGDAVPGNTPLSQSTNHLQ